jgi:hypothetical protein
MSPTDRKYLDSIDVPWIDFEIHPIRFLDDLYFNVESSCHINLSSACIPTEYVEIGAEVLRSKYAGAHAREGSERKLLIIGQTPVDKSIFFDGEFKSLISYLDVLDEIVDGFERVEYKPHPYAFDPKVGEIICSRYSAKICEEKNIYKLFCEGQVSAVAAISSSVLHEAPYFEVKAFALEPRAKKFGPPVSYPKLIRDAHQWIGPLTAKPSRKRVYDSLPPIPKNYLRGIFDSWSYESDEEFISSRILEIESRQIRMEGWARQTVKQAELRTQQIQLQLQSVYASSSWRITRPLREIRRVLHGDMAPVIAVKNGIKRRLRPAILAAMKWTQAHPALKKIALRRLHSFPNLKARLQTIRHGSSCLPLGPFSSKDLSPRAKEIHDSIQDSLPTEATRKK